MRKPLMILWDWYRSRGRSANSLLKTYKWIFGRPIRKGTLFVVVENHALKVPAKNSRRKVVPGVFLIIEKNSLVGNIYGCHDVKRVVNNGSYIDFGATRRIKLGEPNF